MSRRRKSGRDVHGILLLNKPTGISSNDILQKVRKIFGANKAGHTGALDPLATGMLPICFCEATKFSQYLLDSDKCYTVTAQFGVRTDTSDSEGQVIEKKPVSINEDIIEDALKNFRGDILQVPSMYSALKYQGKPLYQYARQGITVERPARPITVFDYSLLRYDHVTEQGEFSVHCSKGTYVRTLVDDLGQTLGCGASVVKLDRTKVADYPCERMVTIDDLKKICDDCETLGIEPFERLDAHLLPSDSVVGYMPKFIIDDKQLTRIMNGQSLCSELDCAQGTKVSIYLSDGTTFVGVGEMCSDKRVQPKRLMRTEELLKMAGMIDNSN